MYQVRVIVENRMSRSTFTTLHRQAPDKERFQAALLEEAGDDEGMKEAAAFAITKIGAIPKIPKGAETAGFIYAKPGWSVTIQVSEAEAYE